MSLLEIVADAFFENRGRKRSERFSLFDAFIKDAFHFSAARIGNDRTVSQCTWPTLHPPLKPANHETIRNIACCFLRNLLVVEVLKVQSVLIERLTNAITLKRRPGVSARHRFT